MIVWVVGVVLAVAVSMAAVGMVGDRVTSRQLVSSDRSEVAATVADEPSDDGEPVGAVVPEPVPGDPGAGAVDGAPGVGGVPDVPAVPAESPIGGGPIVRVGDRMSTFSPALTAAVCAVCETLAKEAKEAGGEYKWQRRLMPGGACEATAFQAYGYEATCVCLPLGNYHNMADLDLVERGDEAAVAHARCGREYIGVEDYHGLIEMLIACATRLDEAPDVVAKMEKLYADKSFVLG